MKNLKIELLAADAMIFVYRMLSYELTRTRILFPQMQLSDLQISLPGCIHIIFILYFPGAASTVSTESANKYICVC